MSLAELIEEEKSLAAAVANAEAVAKASKAAHKAAAERLARYIKIGYSSIWKNIFTNLTLYPGFELRVESDGRICSLTGLAVHWTCPDGREQQGLLSRPLEAPAASVGVWMDARRRRGQGQLPRSCASSARPALKRSVKASRFGARVGGADCDVFA